MAGKLSTPNIWLQVSKYLLTPLRPSLPPALLPLLPKLPHWALSGAGALPSLLVGSSSHSASSLG